MAVTPGHLGTLRLTVSSNFCRYYIHCVCTMHYFKILKYPYVAAQAVHFISLLVKYTDWANSTHHRPSWENLQAQKRPKVFGRPNADSFMRWLTKQTQYRAIYIRENNVWIHVKKMPHSHFCGKHSISLTGTTS
jgi:hypothetical protein